MEGRSDETSRCLYNIRCGVCRLKLQLEKSESYNSLNGPNEFSGYARHLAGPIDDYDPDSSSILGRKYEDLYTAGCECAEPLDTDGYHDIDYNRPTLVKPGSLELIVWIDFPKPTVVKLMTIKTFVDLKEYIYTIFNLKSLNDPLLAHIISDLYSYAVQFGRINALNLQQMSTFLGIIKRVHKKNVATWYTNIDECFEYCKELIFLHSVHRPPFWADIFTKDVAEIVIQYMVSTYFKHFRMYKNAFTNYVVLDVEIIYPNEVEVEPIEVHTNLSEETKLEVEDALNILE